MNTTRVRLCYDVSEDVCSVWARSTDGSYGGREGGYEWCCRSCKVCPQECLFPVSFDCSNLKEGFGGECECP